MFDKANLCIRILQERERECENYRSLVSMSKRAGFIINTSVYPLPAPLFVTTRITRSTERKRREATTTAAAHRPLYSLHRVLYSLYLFLCSFSLSLFFFFLLLRFFLGKKAHIEIYFYTPF